MVVGEAIMTLLRSSYNADDFNNDLEFKVFSSRDFTNNTISNGASLFVYRLYANGAYRTPAGRLGPDGKKLLTELPLEMHFLITVWGKDPSLQLTLAGWIMRILEDTPSLPVGLLNSVIPGTFNHDETVDISLAELRTEDLLRIWDVIGLNVYQLSIPYVARVIHIESDQTLIAPDRDLVQQRMLNGARYHSGS